MMRQILIFLQLALIAFTSGALVQINSVDRQAR